MSSALGDGQRAAADAARVAELERQTGTAPLAGELDGERRGGHN